MSVVLVLMTASGCGAVDGASKTGADGGSWRADVGGTGNTGSGATGGSGGAAAVPHVPGDGTGPAATLPDGKCTAGAYPRGAMGHCQCIDETPDVCDGVCVDAATDDDNCGLCGRSCGPTSTCNGGVCGPVPTDVLQASPTPTCGSIDLAVGNGTLYWAERATGMVQAMDLTTRARRIISAAATNPTRVSVVGSTVFWVEDDLRIERSVVGQTPNTVVTSTTKLGGYVVSTDGGTVYYSTGSDISSVPADGGPSVVVGVRENGGDVQSLVLSRNELAFTESFDSGLFLITLVDGAIASCGGFDVTTGTSTDVNCALVARNYGSDNLIAFADSQIVWGDGDNLDFSSGLPGSFWLTIANTDSTLVGLAATSDTAYISELEDPNRLGLDGFIAKAPLASQQRLVWLARGQENPRSLALDATRVYWSTDDCAIRGTPLNGVAIQGP